MPLALDPNETYEVSLRTDADKPDAVRPRFRFRFMSAREWREYAKFGDDRDALAKAKDAGVILDELFRLLRLYLVGWENMGRAFASPDLDTLLTPGEAWELYYRARETVRLNPEDKKKFDSASGTGSESSAEGAIQADVKKNQP